MRGWQKGRKHGRIPVHLFGPKTEAHKLAISLGRKGKGTKEHTRERRALNRARHRVRIGKAPYCEWAIGDAEFARFLQHIGTIPELMEHPSLGRVDHSKGYVIGNVCWQEHSVNSKLRRGTRFENIAYPV